VKIRPLEVLEAGPKVEYAKRKITLVKNSISDINNRLDARIKGANDIDGQLDALIKSLKNVTKEIENIKSVVEINAHCYQRTNERIEINTRNLKV